MLNNKQTNNMEVVNNPQQIYMLTMENLRCIMHECFAMAFKAKKEKDNEQLLSTSEVLKRCKIDRTTLYRWKLTEYLTPIKVGKKKNYYKLSDLKRLGL